MLVDERAEPGAIPKLRRSARACRREAAGAAGHLARARVVPVRLRRDGQDWPGRQRTADAPGMTARTVEARPMLGPSAPKVREAGAQHQVPDRRGRRAPVH